jgi:hypothetical protein
MLKFRRPALFDQPLRHQVSSTAAIEPRGQANVYYMQEGGVSCLWRAAIATKRRGHYFLTFVPFAMFASVDQRGFCELKAALWGLFLTIQKGPPPRGSLRDMVHRVGNEAAWRQEAGIGTHADV